jgi:DMSO/TMAO reductase YedYZ molybdopterin-dependent catalytic subunit
MRRSHKYLATGAVAAAAVLIVAGMVLWSQYGQNDLTPIDQFFVVTYDGTPSINASGYSLKVNGSVEHALSFTLNDLKLLPSFDETIRLTCVDGPSGLANWTGVRLSILLQMAGVNASAVKVVFRCADGFSTDLTVAQANQSDVMICYLMDGVDLPQNQGYPVRLVAPGYFGYKWAKWIVGIELVDYNYLGYWESRGYSDNGRMN